MEIPVDQNTPDWIRERRGPQKIRVGGSDAGTACGVNTKYSYPFMLYDQIVEEMDGIREVGASGEETAPTEHGHKCEDIIAKFYTSMVGIQVEEAHYWTHRDPVMALMYGCSPDRKVLVKGRFEGILEIKAPYGR